MEEDEETQEVAHMSGETIFGIVVLCLIHWAVVPFALSALAHKRVLGGHKGLWLLPILLLNCLGPLLFLIIHELVPQPQVQLDYER